MPITNSSSSVSDPKRRYTQGVAAYSTGLETTRYSHSQARRKSDVQVALITESAQETVVERTRMDIVMRSSETHTVRWMCGTAQEQAERVVAE
eukprot:scaffold1306_cov98-Skeletonema_dohrnii-CCMP3373.AAC.6